MTGRKETRDYRKGLNYSIWCLSSIMVRRLLVYERLPHSFMTYTKLILQETTKRGHQSSVPSTREKLVLFSSSVCHLGLLHTGSLEDQISPVLTFTRKTDTGSDREGLWGSPTPSGQRRVPIRRAKGVTGRKRRREGLCSIRFDGPRSRISCVF